MHHGGGDHAKPAGLERNSWESRRDGSFAGSRGYGNDRCGTSIGWNKSVQDSRGNVAPFDSYS